MDSASCTYVAPTLSGPVANGAEPPIAKLPDEVLVANIFPYLGSRDLGRTGQVCRRFNILGRTAWWRRAHELCQTCAESLASFGITTLGSNPSQAEVATFLRETKRRVAEIKASQPPVIYCRTLNRPQVTLPNTLRSPCSADDLVCKVDLGYMQEFLKKAHDRSLRAVFGDLAHVPEGASLEESVRLIKDWLQTAEAGKVNRLDLLNCQLFCLPREIGRLTALQWVDLNYNQLASLPPEIGQLAALQWIDLNHNQLRSLPPEIGQLAALQWIDLNYNQLRSLPPEIGQLASLQWLQLYGNRLTALPPEIGRLTALWGLSLGSNQLTFLPPEIRQLTALQWISLNDNRLTSLPPEIRRLTVPHTLGLGDTPLALLPSGVGRLTAPQ